MNSPISLPVLAITLLALALSFAAGRYADGVWIAVCLIAAGIMATVAVFMEASAAYAAGRDDSDEEGN